MFFFAGKCSPDLWTDNDWCLVCLVHCQVSLLFARSQVSGVVRGICKKSNFYKIINFWWNLRDSILEKNQFFIAYVTPGVPVMGSLKKYIHSYKYIYMSEELYHIDYDMILQFKPGVQGFFYCPFADFIRTNVLFFVSVCS